MEQEPEPTLTDDEELAQESGSTGISRSASYLATFGFHRDPFPMAPDDQRFFHPKRIDILLTEILHAILTRKGLILLTGAIGQGKTTLCHRIQQELVQVGVETILFNNITLQGEGMIEGLARAFGIPTPTGQGLPSLLESLHNHFKERLERGINCAILLDDAQELTPTSLEMVRLISNMEHRSQKLVQILLVGQEKLSHQLSTEPLRQLASRVVSKVEARPFTYRETVQYLTFKMITAGCNECLHLSRWAMGTLHRLSGGNPRRINILMDRALYAAYANDQNRITSGMLRQVAREVRFAPPLSPLHRGLSLLLTMTAIAALVYWSGVWSYWKGFSSFLQQPAVPAAVQPAPITTAPPPPSPASEPVVSPPRPQAAPRPIPPDPPAPEPTPSPVVAVEVSPPAAPLATTVLPTPPTTGTSVESVLPPALMMETSTGGTDPIPEVISRFLHAYGLDTQAQSFVTAWKNESWETYSAQLEQETGLRILRMRRPPDWVKKIYPILKVREDLHLLVWRPAPELANLKGFNTGYRGDEIRDFQMVMKRLGFYDMPVDGIVGSGLRQAIIQFQQSRGLSVNGQPSDVTLFFLTHAIQNVNKATP